MPRARQPQDGRGPPRARRAPPPARPGPPGGTAAARRSSPAGHRPPAPAAPRQPAKLSEGGGLQWAWDCHSVVIRGVWRPAAERRLWGGRAGSRTAPWALVSCVLHKWHSAVSSNGASPASCPRRRGPHRQANWLGKKGRSCTSTCKHVCRPWPRLALVPCSRVLPDSGCPACGRRQRRQRGAPAPAARRRGGQGCLVARQHGQARRRRRGHGERGEVVCVVHAPPGPARALPELALHHVLGDGHAGGSERGAYRADVLRQPAVLVLAPHQVDPHHPRGQQARQRDLELRRTWGAGPASELVTAEHSGKAGLRVCALVLQADDATGCQASVCGAPSSRGALNTTVVKRQGGCTLARCRLSEESGLLGRAAAAPQAASNRAVAAARGGNVHLPQQFCYVL